MNWREGRKSIELVCDGCGSIFNRDISEYNRRIRLGKRQFCTQKCAAISNDAGKNVIYLKDYFFKPGHIQDNSTKCTPFLYYIRKAKNRKWKCEVDCEHLMEVWNRQMGKCAITGRNIYLKTHTTASKDLGLFCASLDRVDSTKGYIPGNVQFVSVGINLAKGVRQDSEVLEWLRVIRSGHEEFDYVKSDIVTKMEQLVPL